MLIATFGPSTPWDGTRITWADGRPVLEDHGPITPRDVMEYDRQGYLVWTDEGTRAWIGSLAATGASTKTHRGAGGGLKRALFWIIMALLVVNLVLLVVVGHVVDVLP
jgi:hypothetical protein